MVSNQKKSNRSIDGYKHLNVRIVDVRYVSDFNLRLQFDDGVERTVDMWPLIEKLGGLFEAVKDKSFFAKVSVDPEAGTIVWPNGADFAPDVLYQV